MFAIRNKNGKVLNKDIAFYDEKKNRCRCGDLNLETKLVFLCVTDLEVNSVKSILSVMIKEIVESFIKAN